MMRGMIFDVDGVILDSMGIWMDVSARYLRARGICPEEDLCEKMWTMSLPEGADYLKEHYHLSESAEAIMQGNLAIVEDFYYFEAPMKDGVKEFLQRAKENGFRMIVATSGDKKCVRRAFERLGILDLFCDIITPVEAGAGKTSPIIYQKAAELMGVRVENAYVFEDAIHAAKTAKAAGFKVVGVYDSYSEKDQEELRKTADIYLTSFLQDESFWEEAK